MKRNTKPVYGVPYEAQKVEYQFAGWQNISGTKLALLSHSADNPWLWPADARATGLAVYKLMLDFVDKCDCACPGPGVIKGLAGNNVDMTKPLNQITLFRTLAREPKDLQHALRYLQGRYGRKTKNVLPITWKNAVK